MQELQKLKTSYHDRAKLQGSVYLLPASDALGFVRAGIDSGLSLQGVEGFRILKEGAIQPTQDFSNDLVDSVTPSAFVEDTEALIRRGIHESIWFEVVFEEPIQPPQTTRGKAPRV